MNQKLQKQVEEQDDLCIFHIKMYPDESEGFRYLVFYRFMADIQFFSYLLNILPLKPAFNEDLPAPVRQLINQFIDMLI